MTMTHYWMYTLEGRSNFNSYASLIVTLSWWLILSWLLFDSDITALAKDKIYTHINLEEMNIHQVSTNSANGLILSQVVLRI